MSEKQKHGFEYQKYVCIKYDLQPDEKYTGKWDAYQKDTKQPVVIKTHKKGSEIPLSDIFINHDRDRDFIMIIGVWEKEKSNIIQEFKIEVNIDKWKILLGWEFYLELKDWIRNKVSNDYGYDRIWKKEIKDWKLKWGVNKIIQPRFKRDHKTQRRIQAAIPNKHIKEFLEYVKK